MTPTTTTPPAATAAATAPAFRELPRFLLAILFIVLLLATSLWILRPFLSALIWATLIVVSTWPLMLRLQQRLGGKRSLAVTVMTTVMLLVVILPLGFAVVTLTSHSDDVAARAKSVAQAGLPPPPAWVGQLPVVGARVAGKWQAVADLPADQLVEQAAPYAKRAASWLLDTAGGLAAFLIHLLLTAIIATLLYSSGEAAAGGLRAFAYRLAGARGEQSVTLGGQAIRAVALGVIVTAVVQSLLGGIGLVVAGVPFAGFLTALMFMLGVAQVGATPVMVLAVGWLYWSGNTLTATIFLPWAILVSVLDNILRPLLIKRGADLPLILIFAGVIGGLIAFGVVGLFVGPVVLAIAYTELSAWIADGPPPPQMLPLGGEAALARGEASQALDVQRAHGELAHHDR
ncbi:AI-2E family transporter YdiK [Ramlibacter sp. XY19]|uniref:AI-2E family transporter YdiK n=1 Tax=Ramlibacter paludis TaxID=2908000 RepID=UPI0023DCD125|nr:AI-2E family transporter YdiK [Ramlibacter paludis]MCG2595472.1 AI-2E family transporter YdiK [Ramlibacter paludis]